MTFLKSSLLEYWQDVAVQHAVVDKANLILG